MRTTHQMIQALLQNAESKGAEGHDLSALDKELKSLAPEALAARYHVATGDDPSVNEIPTGLLGPIAAH
ncbi:MAG TPA: hypothetical protein VJL39_01030 [Candidatus Paceibacterota bacterium]